MMPLGSLIIRVTSLTKADSMWYFPLLQGYDWKSHKEEGSGGSSSSTLNISGDHIAVLPDLSDLGDAILWAKTHDAICEKLASNAQALYNRLIALDGELDYLQLMCHEISSRFTPHAGNSGRREVGERHTVSTLAAAPSGFDPSHGGAPVALAPLLSQPPGLTTDWFDAGTGSYADTPLVSAEPIPLNLSLATSDCVCPVCHGKVSAALACAAASAAYDRVSMSGLGPEAANAAAVAAGSGIQASSSRAGSGGARAGGGGGKVKGGKEGKRAAVTTFVPSGTAFANLEKAKAAASRAAQAAKAQAQSLGEDGENGAGGGGKKPRI